MEGSTLRWSRLPERSRGGAFARKLSKPAFSSLTPASVNDRGRRRTSSRSREVHRYGLDAGRHRDHERRETGLDSRGRTIRSRMANTPATRKRVATRRTDLRRPAAGFVSSAGVRRGRANADARGLSGGSGGAGSRRRGESAGRHPTEGERYQLGGGAESLGLGSSRRRAS